jgi:uncharacterized protein
MTVPPQGWPHEASPWHAGELAMQQRAGSAEALAQAGRRVVRAEMPQQHRDFFAQLPFVVLGAADAQDQPWATLIAGAPGFVGATAVDRLRVHALPGAGDPLLGALHEGRPVGLLGIEPQTRRRNRANGRVRSLDESGFTLQVTQSFGNCPQYIQSREFERSTAEPAAAVDGTALAGRAAELVRGADTFFIATQALTGELSGGADASHRGGKPGFVRIDEDGTRLSWPDFAGNRFFNTLGNLLLDPRAGLVFADFASGDLLHVAGRAEIEWDSADLRAFEGAQRLVRLRVERWRLRPGAFPLRSGRHEESPTLARTGNWPETPRV